MKHCHIVERLWVYEVDIKEVRWTNQWSRVFQFLLYLILKSGKVFWTIKSRLVKRKKKLNWATWTIKNDGYLVVRKSQSHNCSDNPTLFYKLTVFWSSCFLLSCHTDTETESQISACTAINVLHFEKFSVRFHLWMFPPLALFQVITATRIIMRTSEPRAATTYHHQPGRWTKYKNEKVLQPLPSSVLHTTFSLFFKWLARIVFWFCF